MKKLTILILLLSMVGCFSNHRYYKRYSTKTPKTFIDKNTFSNKRHNPDKSLVENGLFILQKYSPDAYYIVSHYMARHPISSRKNLKDWFKKKYQEGLMRHFTVVVHESHHMFNSGFLRSMMKQGKIPKVRLGLFQSYHINKGKTIFVRRTKTFPAKEIRHIYPLHIKKDKKNATRFELYIYPSSARLSTQVEGIYGLMDEFTSYYQGTKAAFELLPYYKQFKNFQKSLNVYFREYYNNNYAYGEFKFFILNYLLLAEQKYPNIFKGIINNTNLIRTFLLIDKNYAALIKKFESQKNEIRKWLKIRGYKLVESKEGVWVNRSNWQGFPNRSYIITHDIQMKNFIKEMEKTKYIRMMNLLKKKLTLIN